MIVARDPEAPALVHAPEAPNVSLLLFAAAGNTHAIEARWVSHVGPLRRPLAVPTAPSFVLGVIHERGRIVTVIDLVFLACGRSQPANEGGRLIVLEIDRVAIGIVADRILGVADAPISDVRALEQKEGERMFQGRIELPSGVALVLDAPGLLEVLLDR